MGVVVKERSMLIRLALALSALLLAAGACSSDVCDEAYDKLEACFADQPSCNKLDPLERDRCVKARSEWDKYSGNKTAYTTACSADSNLEAEAEKIAGCALDPKTCTCP
jgi:hypothetical protein